MKEKQSDLSFEVQLTADDMYRFNLYHTYSHPSGIISLLIGLLAFGLGIYNLSRGSGAYAMMYMVLGLVLLIYQPLILRSTSKRQVQATEVLEHPIRYTFQEDGVLVFTKLRLQAGHGDRTSKEGTSALLTWDRILKAVLNKNQLLLYAGKSGAYIIPRRVMDGKEEEVNAFLRDHMASDRLKLDGGK